jgi:CBS domain-containing protein
LRRSGDTPGVVAPVGTEVKATLCVARLSWSIQVMVVPDATVIDAGEKLLPEPAPCGMMIVAVAPLPVLDEEDVVAVVLLLEVVVVVLLLEVVLLDELLVELRLLVELVVALPVTMIVPFIQKW